MTAPSPSNSNGKPSMIRRAMELLEEGKITRTDVCVLLVIMGFRKVENTFAWTTDEKIGGKIGLEVRSIQYSLKRLEAVGLIERVKVAIPDPEDLKNSTGYRFDFTYERVQPVAGGGCNQLRGEGAISCGGRVQSVAPNGIELTETRKEREKTNSCIPPSADTKPGVPAFASTSAAQRAPDFSSSQKRMPESKTPRPTAGELDQALREEAAAGNCRAPIEAFGSSTQEVEPFAPEAPETISQAEISARASLRRTIHQLFHRGKPWDQIKDDLLSCPGNSPQMEKWIHEEVDRARGEVG